MVIPPAGQVGGETDLGSGVTLSTSQAPKMAF